MNGRSLIVRRGPLRFLYPSCYTSNSQRRTAPPRKLPYMVPYTGYKEGYKANQPVSMERSAKRHGSPDPHAHAQCAPGRKRAGRNVSRTWPIRNVMSTYVSRVSQSESQALTSSPENPRLSQKGESQWSACVPSVRTLTLLPIPRACSHLSISRGRGREEEGGQRVCERSEATLTYERGDGEGMRVGEVLMARFNNPRLL